MFAVKSRALATPLAIAVLLTAGGCLFPGTLVISTELPAELQAVIDAPDAFSADPNDPLAAVVPGTLIDDLGGLTGCWGNCSDGFPYAVVYEVYQFDAETGLANRWVLTPGWMFIPSVIVVDEGTFEVVDTGRIEITLDRYTLSCAITGLGQQFTDLPAEIAVIEKLVTLSGDELLLASPYYVDEETGDPLGRVFIRFGCPD
jgi:hypothetical protein